MANPSKEGKDAGSGPKDMEGSAKYAVNALEGLVRKIAEGNAIIYVGAGVSQSAGLPSWGGLLEKLQGAAEGRLKNQPKVAVDHFKELKKKSRSLEVGDWLLRLLGPEFQRVISHTLSEGEELCQIQPSTIHKNLVRSPFRMAITTNYDLLLEAAYEGAYRVCQRKLPYLTWKHTDDILRASNDKDFRIVHAHGTVGDSNSIVLSGSQYALLHNAHPRFGEVLRGLLKNRTFLFVGAGLEDPDLIFQLQEAIAENGGAVGPHYALLPYIEAPQIRRDILRESLHIEAIPVGMPIEEGREQASDWITVATSSILQALAGRVAKRRLEAFPPAFPTSDDPTFCLDVSLRRLLKYAIEFTGSIRGDICLSPDGIDSHLSGELLYKIFEGPSGGEAPGKKVPADSICGIAYYQATVDYGVYVGNVKADDLAGEIASKKSRLGHYGQFRYMKGDDRVQSELALAIEADGVRVGVLNLESDLSNGYGEDHVENDDFLWVARRFAERAGRLYAAAHERNRRGRRLKLKDEEMEEVYPHLRDLFVRLWHLANSERQRMESPQLEFLIYHADYWTGTLVSQDPMKTILAHRKERPGESGRPISVGPQCFPFHSLRTKNSYLATRVFLDGRPYYYPDAGKAIAASKIKNEHAEALGLTRDERTRGPERSKREERVREPIIGFPILIHGHAAGVMVAWIYRSKDEKPNENRSLDGRDIAVFRRASHLMANLGRRSAEKPGPDRTGKDLPPAKARPELSKGNPYKARIDKVLEVLECLTGPGEAPGTVEGRKDDSLDDVCAFYRSRIGPAVHRFLDHLKREEKDFRDSMVKKNSKPPSDWVIPTRCRCWIRTAPATWTPREGPIEGAIEGAKNSQEEKPIFFLAFQLEVKKEKVEGQEQMVERWYWKNRYPVTLKGVEAEVGIAMKPFKRPQDPAKAGGPNNQRPSSGVQELNRTGPAEPNRDEKVPVQWFDLPKQSAEVEFAVFDDNPHLSFLLSRITAYSFSFQQRPRVIGEDIMHKVLEKDPALPWYVAPLLVGGEAVWKDEEPVESGRGDEQVHPNTEARLVGYLTFDSPLREGETGSKADGGTGPVPESRRERVEITDEWAEFQNDLLHQMALFGVCLAQQDCLKSLAAASSA